MVALFDVHCHLDDKAFALDVEEVVKRAEEVGVRFVICNGVNPASNRAILSLAERFPIIKPALGLYPTDALTFDVDKEIAFIREHAEEIIAIGEVGVDYHWIKDEGEKERERENFRKAVALALEIKKPLIIHSRSAEKDTLDILEEMGAKHVDLHCFGGNLKLAKRAVQLGFYLSIPPNIVRSEHFKRMVEELPLSHLLLETDAPYLGPEKEGRNEPANVLFTVREIAKIKGLEEEEVRNHLFFNFQRLFLT